MGLPRSTFYETTSTASDDTAIVEAIAAIFEAFEQDGWRRVRAVLRHQGMIVDHNKIRRPMREHDLQSKVRRRFKTTADSDQDEPVFPNLAKDMAPTGQTGSGSPTSRSWRSRRVSST